MEHMDMTTLDLAALIWFVVAWMGYSFLADYRNEHKHGLLSKMHRYRLKWMRSMIRREDRLLEARLLGNFSSSVTFFASTSILIIGGLLAVLSYGDRAAQAISLIPFAIYTPASLWVIKTTLMIFIFIYAFFKYTWTLRQFNYTAVVIAAAPLQRDNETDSYILEKCVHFSERAAKMLSNAARHFNMGMRSYYFGLAALSWYVHPVLFIVVTTWVIYVLYRREFSSKTLDILQREVKDKE